VGEAPGHPSAAWQRRSGPVSFDQYPGRPVVASDA
jgi:hypothetical protein